MCKRSLFLHRGIMCFALVAAGSLSFAEKDGGNRFFFGFR